MSDKNKTVEEKMQLLREIVSWFESDEFQLEQASDKFTEAAALAKEIETDLTMLKNSVTVLKQSFDEA